MWKSAKKELPQHMQKVTAKGYYCNTMNRLTFEQSALFRIRGNGTWSFGLGSGAIVEHWKPLK